MGFSSTDNGYTLIELLVVILIISLIAMIAAPLATSTIHAAYARSDSSALMAGLRDFQHSAVKTQKTISVTSVSGKLTISSGQEVALSSEASVELKEPITYFPDGTTSGGEIILHDGTHATVIEVTWLTGALSRRSE